MTAPYQPEDESPREACANLCQTFRGLALESKRNPWPVAGATFEMWASRLERAVAKLDAEISPQKLRSLLETYGEHSPDCERPVETLDTGCTCGFTVNLEHVRDVILYPMQGGSAHSGAP